MTPELIAELSDAFRYIFANAFGQFVFYPSEGKIVSPNELLGNQGYVSLEILDNIDLSAFSHPDAGEIPLFWHHPEKTAANLQQKLAAKGHIAILRNQKTGQIEAFSFGYSCTFSEAFNDYEEWKNPFNYSKYQTPEKYLRDMSQALDLLNIHLAIHEAYFREQGFEGSLNLNADSLIYVWNAMGSMPHLRGSGRILDVTRASFSLIPPAMRSNLLEIGETQFDSKAHNMFKVAGAIDVPGVLNDPTRSLEKDDIVMIAAPLCSFVETFSLSASALREKAGLGKKK